MERDFDSYELPAVPGGYREGLMRGIAGYLGVELDEAGDARERAMRECPEAFCRMVRTLAKETREMMREGVPPFDEPGLRNRRELIEELLELRGGRGKEIAEAGASTVSK